MNITTHFIPERLLNRIAHTQQTLALQVARFPGRALFATRFTLEDQVLGHLIATARLPVRFFTRAGNREHDVLVRTVDFLGQNIDVTFSQAELATREYIARYPELAQAYAKNPASAPLGYLLQGEYLFVTGLRAKQWDGPALQNGEPGKRSVFHPVHDWTDRQLDDYVLKYKLPLDLLPPADAERIHARSTRGHRRNVWKPGGWWIQPAQTNPAIRIAAAF